MIKVKLNKPIKSVSGDPIVVKREQETKKITIRDYLLSILGTDFTPEDQKEVFWTTDLGIKISDEKNEVLEISDKKASFLRRIVKEIGIEKGKNKSKNLLKPFEVSQVLKELMTDEDLKEINDE